jgi:MFS family permease
MTAPAPARPEGLRLGLRANLAQFSLLVGVNALVGGMVGQERSLLSLLATEVFGLAAVSAALTYIVAFGLTKAATNFLAGTLADRYGRKPVLVAGWLVGLPVPLLLIWAPTWSWVVAANILLGVNQGLCWSTTVIMKIDLAGPKRRGLAMGLNEAAGYLAVAVTAYLTGLIAARAGLRPEPFYLGLAYAGLGLGLSALLVRETRGHAQLEAQLADADQPTGEAAMADHSSRIAVVTGAGSGIGAAVAHALAGDGWVVVLAGRGHEPLASVAERGAGLPGVLDPMPADVTDEASVRALFDRAVQRHRRVDLLFNNAGTISPARELDTVPLAEWNAAVAVNLTGAFLCIREAFG